MLQVDGVMVFVEVRVGILKSNFISTGSEEYQQKAMSLANHG
jgi:hypothetical protein